MMPKAKGKTSSATSSPTPPGAASAVGISVNNKKKKRRKKDFKIVYDPVTGQATIVGRPDFNSRAKGLIPKADQGQDLDRRHLVHYDEEIKPFGELVIEKVKAKHGTNTALAVKTALASRGCQRLPATEDALLARLITEVNSSVVNLVPDDASINKAIEIVRENLRKLRRQWASDPEVVSIFMELDTANYKKAVDRLKLNAKLVLILSGAGTDITRAIQAINKDLIELIDGAQDVQALYTLIRDLENSVTFDISSKASRDKIAFTNAWRNKANMLGRNALGGADNANDLLMHLVELIEHY